MSATAFILQSIAFNPFLLLDVYFSSIPLVSSEILLDDLGLGAFFFQKEKGLGDLKTLKPNLKTSGQKKRGS